MSAQNAHKPQKQQSKRHQQANQQQPAPNEQYFNASPSSADVRRDRTVTIRGHEQRVQVSNGVFSANRVDLGTSVLLKGAPEPPATGKFLDIGCGWGPITLALAQASPEAEVHAIDVNERALELTVDNAKANGCGNVHVTQVDESGKPLPSQIAGVTESLDDDARFDLIWSNPPIRVGKAVLHTLLMTWLPRLNAGGAAYLVVQKNLGADSLIPWLADALGDEFAVGKYASSKGYRIIEILRQ